MEEELSDSTLAWSWVIEALAKSSLVNASLLYGLVLKAPPLSGDSGKRAREAIALRCLDQLFHPPNGLNQNFAVSDLSEIRFDPAESCEAALQRIVSETSDAKGASDELNWDFKSFIKRKKESLPKSTLEMLEDTILEGTHPHFTPLKEVIGRDVEDQCVLNVPFDDSDPASPPLKSDEEDHADRTMLAEENGCSPRSGVENQQVQGFSPVGNSLACRSGTSTRCRDNHVHEIDAASLEMNNQCPHGKKRKMDREYGMSSKQQHPVLVGSNEMFGTEDGQYLEILKANGVHDRISDVKEDEQAKIFVENNEQQISPNNGNHCREEVDLASKSANFLSSQCALIRDSLAMTESEPNICMKCNKNGPLLSCCARSCALLFHESCLASSVSFDDQGNFYCPFCAYSRAISEYVRTKEKVSQARKKLSVFIGGRGGDQPVHDDDTSAGDNVNQDRHKNANETAEVKGATNVFKDAEPHQTSLKGKPLQLSRSSAYMDANGFVLAARQHLSIKNRQSAEIAIQLSRGPAGIWNHAQDYRGCDGPQFFCDNEQIKNGNVNCAELKRKNRSARCKITEIHGDASSESISDSEGLVQDKTNDGTSFLPSPKPLSAIPHTPVTPQSRRKKVPWTAEEEAMLKKGVETYVHGEGRAIPWKTILEYGGSVFQQGRTPIDLKDKWRNILARGTSPKVK